ncbi:DUF3560 domain-containing protein [Roseibium sp. Sym1]|uniref:DUF3560 domain-containing protein n=1 Tax=Roseibium sp. Sym1 TaxID=3016006 RepID=UPI0022B44D57|nr:DUF3560 domain-containing protein [Roseibium sp. Sym1]
MTTITATYSPEDNKIRLYASSRLDAETYARVKEAGFKWAPRQELFVAPKWTPQREDLALELAGEIEPEEMTLAERAEAKAARLDELAEKRQRDANRFAAAANELSRAFEFGQPILVGHHSERKARKTQERMHSNERKAHKATDLANYWLYRAEGVERHANRKNDPKVRARRIKTLLSELREVQGNLNHYHAALSLWERFTEPEAIKKLIGIGQIATGPITRFGDYMAVENGEKTPEQVRQESIDRFERALASGRSERWIVHILNRLSFEREMLGTVPRHEGELRETAIQMFAREQGAYKPKATKTETGYVLESSVPLPAHIANGKALELDADEWRKLMADCGYSVPQKSRNAKAPILNFDVATVRISRFGRDDEINVQHMTKAEYSAIYSEHRGTFTASDGSFRVRVCLNPKHEGPRYQAGWVAVFLTDSKAHPIPESDCIVKEAA